MKIVATLTGLTVSALACWQLVGDRPPGPPPRHPVMELFDTDDDGQLTTAEIDQAPALLKKLDRNSDGLLTPNELPRPPRPRDERPRPRPPRGDDQRPGDGQRGNDQRSGEEPINAPAGTVLFRGGYETDPRDGGRPVGLIAAALGVEAQVFRDAFSGVNPARGGEPSASRVQANKKVLMDALGKYGITNDRLDEVSNFYRYRPQDGELWSHEAAQATAVIEDGKVTGFKITNPGYGYLSTPQISVVGYPDLRVEAKLEFGTDLHGNGRVASLSLVNP